MAGEIALGAAAGVGTAVGVFVFDQNLAMASAGGVAFLLAVSVTIPLQKRLWFSIGSFILGYIVGLFSMAYGGYSLYAPLLAFVSSALGSSAFASLHNWVEGGVKPAWLDWLARMSPIRLKKGDPNE